MANSKMKILNPDAMDALETLADALYRLVEAGIISKLEARTILREYGVLPPDDTEERNVSTT